MTTYINLFGGPGSGKSTTAARLFSEMKIAGYDVELVTEVAKDFVWEERNKTLQIQPYITVKQFRNLYRLQDKVEYVITDAPVLLGYIYGKHYTPNLPQSYFDFVVDMHRTLLNPSINYLLKRKHEYDSNGRYQSEDEAEQISNMMKRTLEYIGTPYAECLPQEVKYVE